MAIEADFTDGELLARFAARRDGPAVAAFAALVRRHGPGVLATAGRALADPNDAEDAFLATFLVLARSADLIRWPRGLGRWLGGVARRAARELCRRGCPGVRWRIGQPRGPGTAAVSESLVGATARAAAGFVAAEDLAELVPAVVGATVAAVLADRARPRLGLTTAARAAVGLAVVVGVPATWRSAPGGAHGGHPPAATATAPAPPVAVALPTLAEILAPSIPPPVAAPPPIAAPTLAPGDAGRHEGARLFRKEWVVGDAECPGGDGLGPLYNAGSCVACHDRGGVGGAGGADRNIVILTAARLDPDGPPATEADYSGMGRVHPAFRAARSILLHRSGTDPAYEAWRGAFFRARSLAGETGDGPPRWLDASFGRTIRVAERNPPPLFGAGLIDAIPDAVIRARADADPEGRNGRVAVAEDGTVGRFGWRGQDAHLEEAVRRSAVDELGLAVVGRRGWPSPLGPGTRPARPDLADEAADAIAAYVRSLPAPVAIDPWGPLGSWKMADGRRLFAEVGCTACHAPTLGDVRGIYSDLLLHDMGPQLREPGDYGVYRRHPATGPSPGEWRTPPLWGYRDSGPYLHDGRAETLEVVVSAHAGEAGPAAARFFALEPPERGWIEAFLGSLVAPPAAPTPGLIPAAELEARDPATEAGRAAAVGGAARRAELDRRAQADRAREEADEVANRERDEAIRRDLAAATLRDARTKILMATNLEHAGKIAAAVNWYRVVVREAGDTPEGRFAAERIAALAPPDRRP